MKEVDLVDKQSEWNSLPFFQMAVRQRFAENAADVLNENIQLLGTAYAPHFRCYIFIAP